MNTRLLAFLGSLLPLLSTSAPAQECSVAQVFPEGTLHTSNPEFGSSIAVTGNVAVVGGPLSFALHQGSIFTAGAAYACEFQDGAWTVTQRLEASPPGAGGHFGCAVDTDGVRIVVGEEDRDSGGATDAGRASVFSYNGTQWELEAKFYSTAPQTNGDFGAAVAVSGSHIAVGDPQYDTGLFNNAGQLSFFEFDGVDWSLSSIVPATGPVHGGNFGAALSMEGDLVAVSAPGAASDRGQVRLYEWDGLAWTSAGQLTPAGLAPGDRYGESLDLSGDLLVVGAPGDDEIASGSGAAYLWRRTGGTWSLEQKLLYVGGLAGEARGSSVSVDGNYAAVGSPHAAADAGVAATFFFNGTSWAQAAVPATLEPGATFGTALAISGPSLLVGAPETEIVSSSDVGTVRTYRLVGGLAVAGPILEPSDVNNFDAFGFDLDLDGVHAVVGAPGDEEAASGGGAVYVYRNDGQWPGTPTKLFAGNAASSDGFGNSVAVDGDTLVAGCPKRESGGGTDAGAVYLFEHDGFAWDEDEILVPAGLGSSDRFGTVVALDGDVLMAAALGDDDVASNAGAVYVYRRNGSTWILEDKLAPLDLGAADAFGCDIAIDGDTALIGAYEHDAALGGAGAAYFFEFDGLGWSQGEKLLPPNPVAGGAFGRFVDLVGDLAVVTAPGADGATAGSGLVDVFRNDGFGWDFEQELYPADGQAGDAFGMRASISGNRVLVGASLADVAAPDGGGVYLFRYQGSWVEEMRFAASDTSGAHAFGHAAALDGTSAFVCAGDHPAKGPGAGAAYFFQLPPEETLIGSQASISLSAGGAQALQFATTTCLGGSTYLVLGSASGTSPGFPLGSSLQVPLNPDPYTVISITAANGPVLQNTLGLLDSEGAAAPTFALPPGMDPGLAGLTLNHAAVVANGTFTDYTLVSNPVPVTLVP